MPGVRLFSQLSFLRFKPGARLSFLQVFYFDLVMPEDRYPQNFAAGFEPMLETRCKKKSEKNRLALPKRSKTSAKTISGHRA